MTDVRPLDLGRSNNSTSDARSSVAGGLAELVSAQAQVIGIGVHDQGAAHNVVGSGQRDLGVADVHLEIDIKNHSVNRSSP